MNTIYATYTDPHMAEKAAGALLDHGVKSEHVSILLPEGYAATREDIGNPEKTAESGITTTTAGDAGSGAAKGAGLGVAAGVLAGLASVFVPGFGLVLGGGALAIAIGGLVGTTAAGAIAGGVTGYLKDQGVPDEAITRYENTLRSGGAMITVTPGDENVNYTEIESVLAKYDGTVAAYANRATLI